MMEVDTCAGEEGQDEPQETVMPVHTNIKNIRNKSRRSKAFVELKREKRKVSSDLGKGSSRVPDLGIVTLQTFSFYFF